MLENEKRKELSNLLIVFVLAISFSVTLLKALRWPNDWSKAHWLINYQLGFLKRAFPGTLLKPFIKLFGNTELTIIIVSCIFLGLFSIMIFWICVSLLKKMKFDLHGVLFVSIFLTSSYIVMSAHLNGYYDNIIIILTILSCQFLVKNKQLWASLIMAVGMLIHETALFIGFPSLLFVALLLYIKNLEKISYKNLIFGFLNKYKILILLPFIAFSCIFIYQKFNSGLILEKKLETHISSFHFIEEDAKTNVSWALTSSFFGYLKYQSPFFIERITFAPGIKNVIIPLLLLLVFVWGSLKSVKFRSFIFLILTILTLSPLALHLIAWDTMRIWTFPFIILLIGTWSIFSIYPFSFFTENRKKSLLFMGVASCIIIGQQLLSIPLMDNEVERFSIKLRIVMYAPLLMLIIFNVQKKYT